MPAPAASGGPRFMVAAANTLGAGIAVTLVLGPLSAATPMRGWLVAACAFVYVARVILTMYITVQPPLTLVKGTLVGSGMLVIHVAIGFVASLAAASVGWWALAGIVLYGLGSWLNTASETQRVRWKKRPRNVGHLYTRGLFRTCRHPDYLGDTIVFIGFALIAGSPVALILPIAMAAGYVFAAIPARDRRLAENYGDEFNLWAARSRRYIPFVY
ncbi:DUF1295 domain-containing protein [Diaminobutyricibacter tongyongensis]|uniref:DUF1295 domain-containing protein n=1 Tax=Leifsonia tongyongensis TaxID=1268043 RepID=A0A6L9XTF1_9MICO|nr:DUF1295 domain-containing protein [Diaminobutyricibacter tongyongensis]